MGFAPVVLGAVSTVAQMAGQARQADSQRQQIAAQGRAAEQQYQLQLQRFEFARNDAAQTYQREALVAEEMRRNAVTQFEMANVQQNIADRYEQVEADVQDNQLKNRVTQLLANASSVRGQASLSNAGMYQQLVQSMGGDEQAANSFLQNMLAMGAESGSTDAVRQQSLLASVAAYQNTLEATDTTSRVAGFQAQAQEDEAALTGQYRQLTKQFLDSQRQINSDFRSRTNEHMPSILELQHQRNMESLNTASFARQAEMSLGQQSALIGRGLQQTTTQAQMAGIPSGMGIALGGLAGIAGQTLPFILQNRGGGGNQIGPPPGGLNGYTNQYPVIEWGQPLPGRQPAQQVQWGQPLPRQNFQDVTGRIYV